MQTVDLRKELKHLYQPSAREVSQVQVPSMNFLMIDGEGDPNYSHAYSETVEALFTVSYAIKFMVKKGSLAIDYGVMPLEGLWWADDMSSFSGSDKSRWKWTMMIMQPSFVTKEIIGNAMAEEKKKKNPPALAKMYLEEFSEGLCAQILHVGPFQKKGRRLNECINTSTLVGSGQANTMKSTCPIFGRPSQQNGKPLSGSACNDGGTLHSSGRAAIKPRLPEFGEFQLS
jgi:hypothetical protein